MISTSVFAEEKLTIEKQLVGIVGAISGTVKTETRELKAGDKIYLNETIVAGAGSGTQILLLDQSTFTIGEDSEVVMDTFIFDPATNDGKIVASVKQGSLKVISGLISKKNPDSLTVEVPEGTLGSRGTEFQTIVSKGKTDTLLIGSTLLDNPYSMASMTKGKAPGQAKKITKNQLKKFNKKMKALRVAKLSPEEKKGKRKEMKKQLRKELKSMGFEKEEIKSIIKENIQKDKEKKVAIKKERAEKKKAKKKKAKAEKKKNKKKKAKKVDKKKGKKKKATKKGSKKKKAVKKKEGKKKKATKKKATKKKAVKKKPAKKKKAVKKKAVKKKKVVKKKKKVVKKKKPKKKIKKKVANKRKIVKKKRAAKKKKAKKKRRKKK